MGTNRMSAKPRDGVVNKLGQTHDIKNLFVSDGSQWSVFERSGIPVRVKKHVKTKSLEHDPARGCARAV
jgi:hypothetical protein